MAITDKQKFNLQKRILAKLVQILERPAQIVVARTGNQKTDTTVLENKLETLVTQTAPVGGDTVVEVLVSSGGDSAADLLNTVVGQTISGGSTVAGSLISGGFTVAGALLSGGLTVGAALITGGVAMLLFGGKTAAEWASDSDDKLGDVKTKLDTLETSQQEIVDKLTGMDIDTDVLNTWSTKQPLETWADSTSFTVTKIAGEGVLTVTGGLITYTADGAESTAMKLKIEAATAKRVEIKDLEARYDNASARTFQMQIVDDATDRPTVPASSRSASRYHRKLRTV